MQLKERTGMKSILSICPKHNICSLCIGKFDGMHIGHQALFSKINASDGGVLRISYDSLPLITPEIETLLHYSIYEVKLHKIKDFNCAEFVGFLKKNFPNLKRIVVGYDFKFGKDRSCSPRDLEEFFEVCIVSQVKIDGIAVHKQSIAQALREGQIKRANAMLGREYEIKGEVIKGQGIGAKECVPTINLKIKDYLLPKSGVYATWSEIKGAKYKSVSFLGHRLSSDGEFAIETHFLDHCVTHAPKEAKIYFVEFLRENQKFDSLSSLKEQIQKDILNAKKIL